MLTYRLNGIWKIKVFCFFKGLIIYYMSLTRRNNWYLWFSNPSRLSSWYISELWLILFFLNVILRTEKIFCLYFCSVTQWHLTVHCPCFWEDLKGDRGCIFFQLSKSITLCHLKPKWLAHWFSFWQINAFSLTDCRDF